MEAKKLSNLRIWLSGASRGIGYAIACKLVDTGATLILSARNSSSFENVRLSFSNNKNVFFFPYDITKPDDISKCYDRIKMAIGGVDILINNAGVVKFHSFNKLTLEDFDYMNAVNYRGVFLCIKAVLPDMIERKDGVIINTISVVITKAFKNSSVYSASKSAVWAMANSLREEVRSEGIKIVNILPGATETDVWSPENRQRFSKSMMQPKDVADAVYYVIELSLNNRLMIEEVVLRPQGGDL